MRHGMRLSIGTVSQGLLCGTPGEGWTASEPSLGSDPPDVSGRHAGRLSSRSMVRRYCSECHRFAQFRWTTLLERFGLTRSCRQCSEI